jgi:hypothetical protein
MDDKILKDAQYRKGLSIAYFNSLNAAIEMIKTVHSSHLNGIGYDLIKKEVAEWRDFFLDEHKEYYARVIAKVGTNYNAEEAIKRLKSTKTLEDLRNVWQSLSEDERQDKEIVAVKDALKKKHEKV